MALNLRKWKFRKALKPRDEAKRGQEDPDLVLEDIIQ